jgi:hypothetical protein
MVSHLVITTLQAACLSAISNLAAQAIKAYREEVNTSRLMVRLRGFVADRLPFPIETLLDQICTPGTVRCLHLDIMSSQYPMAGVP